MKPFPRRGLLAAVLLAALLGGTAWLLIAGPLRPAHQASFNPADLSSTERAQLAEVVLTIAEAPQETMAEARKRAWEILRPHRVGPAAVRLGLEPIFLKIGQGPRLFWTDAQQAIAERRPVKSAARTQWEAELMGDGWLTLAQQHRYDDFMKRIARGEPVESSHGVEIAVDDRIVRAITDSLDEDELRTTVAELLTPPE